MSNNGVFVGISYVSYVSVNILSAFNFLNCVLRRYVKHHYLHQLNQPPNYEYLGHPINSYHLVRHVASGWDNIMKNVLGSEVHSLSDELSM